MRKPTRRSTSVHQTAAKRVFPSKRTLLSQAIALAGVGLGAPAMAACPGTVTAPTAATCTLTGMQTATVTSTGSINVTGGSPAINVTGSGVNVTITNNGTISGDGAGISADFPTTGTMTITNNANGAISGGTTGVFATSGVTVNLTNDGTISASGAGGLTTIGVGAVVLSGPHNGTITNNGTLSASGTGSTAAGVALVLYSGVTTGGSVSNTGTISGSATGTGALAAGTFINADMAGTIANSGTMSGAAMASSAAIAAGLAIVSGDLSGTLNNSGTISGSATGGFVPTAAGILLISGDLTGTLTNSGTISGSAAGSSFAQAYGAYFEGDLAGTIDNSGTISGNATANGGASATGIYLSSSMLTGSTLTNSGTVSATATSANNDAEAVGIFIYDMEGATFTNTATGVVSATASGDYASATGVLVYYTIDSNSTFTNAGSISATATGATESATAYGVYVDDYMEGVLLNSGTITATATAATDAEAYGIYLSSTVTAGASVTNSGSISATATATSDSAEAYGIYVDEQLQGTLDNSGSITATANGVETAEAYGLYLSSSIATGAIVTNSGSITVTATASTSDATAYGIFANDGDVLGTVANSGTITVTATAANSAEATGINVYTMLTGASLSNSGTVTVTATTSGSGDVTAEGLDFDQVLGATVTSSGTITVTGSGGSNVNANGIDMDTLATGSVLTNSGTITATASTTGAGNDADATGIGVANFQGDATLTNTATGNITVSASGDRDVEVEGIYIGGTIASTASVTNAGAISVTATQTGTSDTAEAFGIEAETVAGTITNTGTIDVTANGAGGAVAVGILVGGETLLTGGTVLNSGTIDVHATVGSSGLAAGIFVGSMQSGSTLTNSGTVTASLTATGSAEAGAAGIYVEFMSANSNLTNSGTVSASATNAQHYSIYVGSGSGVTINNSGTIDGQMLLGNSSLTSSGRVRMPVGDVGLIDGDYTQTAGGVFEVGVLGANAGEYGRMDVTGTADISASDQLAVDVSANDRLMDADVIDNVLSAGTLITGGNMAVSDNSALWAFSAVDDGMNNIDLLVDRALFVADSVRMTGAPLWAIPAGESMDSIITAGATGDMAAVVGELSTLSTAEELAAAAADLVPVLVGQSSQAANLSVNDVANAISARILNRGVAAGDAGREQHLWVRAFGTESEQDDEPDAAGWEVENYGFVLGYDTEIGSQWNVGVAAGYSQPEAESDNSFIDHEIEIEGYQLAAYGDWQGANSTFVELIGVVGFNNNESERHITFAGLDRTAEGDYDSWYARLYGAVGHSFAMSDKFTLTPVAHVGYTYVDEDSYLETGADALNLDVDSNTAESLIIGVDGRMAFAIGDNGSQITGFLGVGYDTMTDDSVLAASFSGGGPVFKTVSAEPEDLLLRAGIGVEWVASDRAEVHVRYTYEDRDEFSNQLLVATFRWAL